MARIRSIKPEFWTSEQVMECSPNARLLFIGMWNFCDDAGRHPASPKQIKALVFPADDFTVDDIRRMLDELSTNDLIRLYAVDGKEYFSVTGWRHQKIDRPQPAKYPGPVDDHSSNDRDGAQRGAQRGKDDDSSLRSESSAACWTRARLDALTDGLIEAGSIGELRPTWIDVSPIVGLIDAGYDLEVDILPKIREGTARLGKPAKSPRYFVEAIRDTGSTRQGLTAAGRQHDPPRQNPLMQAVDKLERELTDERPYDDGPVLDLQVLGN